MTSQGYPTAVKNLSAAARNFAKKRRNFRKDIQALRAIAVMAVILNHLWPTRFTGGYVGVDIFFVISGFLITTHLLSEMNRTGRIALAKFYVRRIKRLLPAAFTVIALTLVLTITFLPADRWVLIARESFGSTVYIQNWLLAASAVDYRTQSVNVTPVQHYWSLSVEEQFYLLWPIVIIGVFLLALKLRSKKPTALLATATWLLIAISFSFSVVLTAHELDLAYFHTFSRAWEFLFGGAAALLAPASKRLFAKFKRPWIQGVTGWVSLLVIAWSILFFDAQMLFPAPWGALPVLATALIIFVGPDAPRWSPFAWARTPFVQYTGNISYSLYLWHWPIFMFLPFIVMRENDHVQRVAILILSFVFAGLSKKFIEDPGQAKLLINARPRKIFAILAGVSVVFGLAALAITASAAKHEANAAGHTAELMVSECFGAGSMDDSLLCDDPFGPAVVAPKGEHNAPWFSPDECTFAPADEQILYRGKPSLIECDFSVAGAESKNVWLFGDFHAEHWKAAVYEVARAEGWKVTSSTAGGCPALAVPLVAHGPANVPDQVQTRCLDWADEVAERITLDRPDMLITSAFASFEIVDDGSDRVQAEQLAEKLESEVENWLAGDADLVVIRDVPVANLEMGPACVVLHGSESAGCVAPEEQVLQPDPFAEAALSLGRDDVFVADLSDNFCRDGVCSGVIGGLPVYYDNDHLSHSFSKTLAPALHEALEPVLGG